MTVFRISFFRLVEELGSTAKPYLLVPCAKLVLAYNT